MKKLEHIEDSLKTKSNPPLTREKIQEITDRIVEVLKSMQLISENRNFDISCLSSIINVFTR